MRSNVQNPKNNALGFRVNANVYFIPFGNTIDVEAEKARFNEELKYNQGFMASVRKKLYHEKFMAGATEAVVASERKKETDALGKIATIEASLKNLGKVLILTPKEF